VRDGDRRQGQGWVLEGDEAQRVRERPLGRRRHGEELEEGDPHGRGVPDALDRGYAKANQQKPSDIDTKKRILRLHVVPFFGSKRLDEIRSEDVQGLKSRLAHRSPKTVSNVLSVLATMLRVAVEWEVIPSMPCRLTCLKTAKSEKSFLAFDDLERLIEGAKKVGWLPT
jgi:hypothetical protein